MVRIRCRNPNRATKLLRSALMYINTDAHQRPFTLPSQLWRPAPARLHLTHSQLLGNDLLVRLELISVQPHPPHTCPLHTPIYLFLLGVACEQKAKYCPELYNWLELPSTPFLSLICSSTSSSPSITIPLAMENSPFPNPTSALSRLSYTPESSCRRPPSPNIPAVCASQTDGQFPLLSVFSRRWKVDEP